MVNGYGFIFRFLWGIGTSHNTTDVMEFMEYSHYERSACIDIALNHSDTYYNIIRAYNQAINSRASQKSSDGGNRHIVQMIWP